MADIKLYTLPEVSKIVRLARRTLYNYLKSGELKAVKIGGTWRVTEESLNEFINRESNQRPPWVE